MKLIASVVSFTVGLLLIYLVATFYLGHGVQPWEPEWPGIAAEKASEIPEDGQRLVEWVHDFFEPFAKKMGMA